MDWVKFNTDNKIKPKLIIASEYMADSVIISSTANSYVFVASVSKLNGLKISVKGRSFMISTKEIQKAIIWLFCSAE